MTKTPKSQYFCPAPFKNLVQDYLGRCGPCPYISGTYNYTQTEIPKRWTGEPAGQLRQELLDGKKPAVCERCHLEEEAGMNSRRLFELNSSPNFWEEMQDDHWRDGPEVMVLRLSNICNYACRTCHAIDTSKYDQEGKFYAETYGDKDNRYIAQDPRTEFSMKEMEQLYELSKNLKRLEFYGGEPMINDTHEVLLSKLVEDGRSQDIWLYYNTNGSVTPSTERQKLWSNFKAVQLNWSLDGIENFFHYVRWPGNWKETRERIVWAQEELPKITGKDVVNSVNITVSALNIFNLDEIVIELGHKLKMHVSMTIVHDPAYYSPQVLPESVKQVITEKLSNPKYENYFDGITSFMNQKPQDPELYRQFLSWTAKKDAYRKLRFEDHFPDYHRHLAEDLAKEAAKLKSL